MDIIVTTPQSASASAAAEAAHCKREGGGRYFRRLAARTRPKNFDATDRIFYVERGFIRGFAVASSVSSRDEPITCSTTGHVWQDGFYIFMDASSWKWIKPIPMTGFQGWRYYIAPEHLQIVGGWLDPMPESPELRAAV